MGVLVTFESAQMLLQREDFPAALRALKKLSKDVPELFHDAASVARCKDLASALVAAEFPGTFDEHGDLVGLRYVGEKLPPAASDDFPDHLIIAWKKLLREAVFDRWIEGTVARRFWVDRGVVRAQNWDRPSRRFEQVGPEPRCRPGGSVEVAFRYVSTIGGDEAPVQVRTGQSYGPCLIEFAQRTMKPGDVATLVVRVEERADQYQDQQQFVVYGDEGKISVRGWISLALDVDDDLEHTHVIVATESQPKWWKGAYLPGKKVATALDDIRRYAARHAAEPGGEFLPRVASATEFSAALRELGFEPTLAGADVRSLGFAAKRLPGSERHVLGLLRSFAPLTQASGEVRLAYADSPSWWTAIEFSKGALRRLRRPRSASSSA